ncbi:uncharacterized protein METZ01_LOCUS487598, partial [marine metagenome]
MRHAAHAELRLSYSLPIFAKVQIKKPLVQEQYRRISQLIHRGDKARDMSSQRILCDLAKIFEDITRAA